VVILERTYFVTCNCETKKELSLGFWLDDGENVCLASASAGFLERKITATDWQIFIVDYYKILGGKLQKRIHCKFR